MSKKVYLDYAAATPLDPKVLMAMKPYFTEEFYNPSAIYLSAKKVKKDIEQARAGVAKILGTRPAEVIFTAGGTEANNLAIKGVMKQFPGANVVVSAIEHESVLAPAEQFDVRLAPVDKQGIIDLSGLEKLIDDKTALVSVIYANNEIGTIQPLRRISQLLGQLRTKRKGNLPLYFHTDAAQAGNYLDLHANRLGVDMMTLNGGKIYGPKQSGALYIKTGTKVKPQVLGGGQERGMRSGTENVAGIVGFAKALELTQKNRSTEVIQLEKLQKLFIELLRKNIPNVEINGSLEYRLANNIHITIPGQDNERLIMALDEAGILCAAGSACSASDEEPSHVLKTIGLTDEQAQSSLRFSMGKDSTETDIKQTVKTLAGLING
ncbi:MAG TPA: cysteine desulfurase family protein [Candidatus Saccharimonadales bacterium]|nr:cysteine desulfurase family protein [Candidatus Saccharimonadales bacterium]